MAPIFGKITGPRRCGPLAGRSSIYPDADKPFDETSFDVVLAQDENHGFRQPTNVSPHIATVRFEIQDRISNQLSWTVVGDVAPTTRLDTVNTSRL